ncbi:Hypothetical protein R9X50_00370800 [Acrodontium crateriforme]|uniref:ML-like domain-containing protein n=1 Tax=Acrodontium crateriforme TaxID=150365 RepID=A0AAQ3M4P2_9PEZI|nr:Hypothetical protein R9X50_00370800 [Acrodontium crateriforme]
MSAFTRGACPALSLALAALCFLLPSSVQGAFINFQNCLDTGILNSANPQQLQFVPLFVDARFDAKNPTHNLNLTVYGNVTGQQREGTYPPANSSDWTNNSIDFGKITNAGDGNTLLSTLLTDFKVLGWDAYNAKPARFCGSVINGSCPLGPLFYANASDPYDLHTFSVAHNFESPYSFTTLAGTVKGISADTADQQIFCVSANVTPDLGPSVTGLLTWLPAVVLIVHGIATLSAAIWSPWGSSDIFRWSSNYGRDEDLLRLVTPGFGDCLQYIQFVTLTGALSLQYPGFYQPAVSQTAWSLLLFNQSFVSHGSGTNSLVDGIYAYNGTNGMTAMSQLIGMSEVEDVWACMAIWLLVIAGTVALLCQLGFFGRWIYRTATKTSEEDLRKKNLPFTVGNMVRLLFNFFILPIVALSLFQLIIAPSSPSVVVAVAVVLLVVMITGGAWILKIIFSTKPRTILFDDMPIVLLYGPLYNTYSDSAAPFALVPVFITFMRGVALGAIQPSGIAQIIVLAICEVILILTLNGFRPFQGQTSMNAYHTFFAVIRLITILLSVTFIPPLNIGQSAKGWVGYIILFLHACVLIFGFFLNSAQTLIEVVARACGVGGDGQHGAIRGSILNMRMLKQRQDRSSTRDRASMGSNAAILQGDALAASRRSRSVSASSHQLLNRAGAVTPSTHRISGFDNVSSPSEFPNTPDVDSSVSRGAFTYLPANDFDAPINGPKFDQEGFYRPPRPRKATMDTVGSKTRPSGDFPYQDSPDAGRGAHLRQVSNEPGYKSRETPAPAFFRLRADSDDNTSRTDYAVREVDQYYRGPPLSDLPTRNLKTGPADPVGPAASAQTWFQRMMYGMKNKKKEPTKGFEVTRSARMPPSMQAAVPNDVEMQNSPPMTEEPYRDSPPIVQSDLQAGGGAERTVSPLAQETSIPQQMFTFGFDGLDNGKVGPGSTLPGARTETPQKLRPRPSGETNVSDYEKPSSSGSAEHIKNRSVVSSEPPLLGPIDSVGNIDLPSRFASQRSNHINNSDIGRNWLGAIDGLDWTHPSHPSAIADVSFGQRSTQRSGVPSAPPLQPSPSVPRRSSRRSLSQDIPRGTMDGGWSQFESRVVSPLEPGTPNEYIPQGVTRVSHHRAADSITRNSFGANAALQGASAEIYGRHESGEEHTIYHELEHP